MTSAAPSSMSNPSHPKSSRSGDLRMLDNLARSNVQDTMLWHRAGFHKHLATARGRIEGLPHKSIKTNWDSGTHDRQVQVWAFDSKKPLIPIFSVELSTMIPYTVQFKQMASRNLLVFRMYDSEIRYYCQYKQGWTYDVSIGIKQVKIYSPMYQSGHTAVDAPQTLFLIDNVVNRFSLHCLEDGACIHTYNTNPVKTFPKQVVFRDWATLVVGGSDTGTIQIFDKNDGALKQVLQHTDRGQVQTVTYKMYDSLKHSLIFGATSTNDVKPTISIWCRKCATSPSDRPLGSEVKNFIRRIIQLAIAMVTIAYVSNMLIEHLWGITSLGNAWREYSKLGAQLADLTNTNICSLVEQYIEALRGEELERVQSSGADRRHDGQAKLVKPQDMLHEVILLRN
ncbi:hypothetical protein BDR07DRAFT_1374402 [Suillus spraguei]|nr:hypothetical protein BDR07DRAFT_1374402 [Suillus spraguei]